MPVHAYRITGYPYHQRQVTFCVNAPPIKGPTTEATAKVAESELVIAGLTRGLEHREIMMKHPEKVPAQPVPVTARPAIKASLFGASASIIRMPCVLRFEVGALTANQTAHFKDEDTQEKDRLHREIFVRLPPHGLCGRQRKEHCRAIPAHVCETVEVIGNRRDSGGDDGLARVRKPKA
jgi:hypothetical protein